MPSAEYMRAWRESKGPCGVDGCDGLYLARGYCKAHYKRLKAYVDPLGRPAPRTRKVVEKRLPRVPKYKVCEEHIGYMAGCPMCQAGARMRPVNLERRREKAAERGRDRSGESRDRSVQSRSAAREKWKARTEVAEPARAWQRLTAQEVDLILSDMPALSIALMTGRSVGSVYHARHRMRRKGVS